MDISDAVKNRGEQTIRGLFDELKSGAKPDLNKAHAWVDILLGEISQKAESKLNLLQPAALEDYIFAHSVNVAIMAGIMAWKSSITDAELHEVTLGGLLHDIGKINTPDELIWKQKGDNEYEMTAIAEHPVFGAHWLSTNCIVPELVEAIIRSHHETLDGKGYPDGKSERELARGVNIVSICNYYEYFTHDLPGRPAMDARDICFMMSQQVGKIYSARLIASFVNNLGPMLMDGPLFQKTALVLLNTREVGAVMSTKSFGDLEPDIAILTDSKGQKLPRPFQIQLRNDRSRQIVKILRG